MSAERAYPNKDSIAPEPLGSINPGSSAAGYLSVDECGAIRVGQTGISLDSVVQAFQEGASPDAIRERFPALDLEQVYGTIAYYLGNRGVVQSYLERQDEVWRHWRARSEENPPPVAEKLKALRRAA